MIWRLMVTVFVGSGLGGVCRFMLSEAMMPLLQPRGNTYLATLAVNILGCLVIGLIYGAVDRSMQLSPVARLFLTTGFCGGLTTFSTFAREGMQLIASGQPVTALLYTLGSVVIGFGAAYAGSTLARL